MKRKLSAIFLAYLFLLLTMLRWHFSHDATHLQPTLGLFVVFAVSGALAGLMSVWAALGALHWAKRLPSFVVAVAVFIGGWLLFVDWNKNAIWEMVVLISGEKPLSFA